MSDKHFLSFEYRLPGGGVVRQTINRALLPEEMDDKEMQKLLRIITEEAAERGRREETKACMELASQLVFQKGFRLHPDIPWDKTGEGIKMAANMAAQRIAVDIRVRLEEK